VECANLFLLYISSSQSLTTQSLFSTKCGITFMVDFIFIVFTSFDVANVKSSTE
jgi:hypothetical protein